MMWIQAGVGGAPVLYGQGKWVSHPKAAPQYRVFSHFPSVFLLKLILFKIFFPLFFPSGWRTTAQFLSNLGQFTRIRTQCFSVQGGSNPAE